MSIRNDRSRTDVSSKATVEQLEGRRLLAGNVFVIPVPAANAYVIVGDNQANDLVVTGLFNDAYTITGANGTTINGSASPLVVDANGPNGSNFLVLLGGGDDKIEFGNTSPGFSADTVIVNGGAGGDTVGFHNVTAFGGLDIQTAAGDDDVTLDFVDIHKGLNIDTGAGEDTVTFGNTGTGVTVFDGNARVNGGADKDTLNGEANLHVLQGTKTILSF
jgi:hypothetical protein